MAGLPEFAAGRESAQVACEDVRDDLAAYVWGALEPDALARVESHRRHCAACDRWLRDSGRVISHLDQAMPRVAPAPELRSRLLRALDDIPQPQTNQPDADTPGASMGSSPPDLPTAAPVRPSAPAVSTRLSGPGVAPTAPRGSPPTGGPTGGPTRSSARGVPPARLPDGPGGRGSHGRPRPTGDRWRANPFLAGLTTGLVGCAVAAVFVLLLVVRPAALSWLAPRPSELGSTEPGPPPPSSPLLPISVGSSSARLLELRSPSAPGRGLLLFDTDTRRGVLLLEGLDSQAGGEYYAVWLVQGLQRVQLGSLTLDARGVGTFVLPDPLPLERPERIEVTAADQPGPVLTADF